MTQDHGARSRGVRISQGLSDSKDLALPAIPRLPAVSPIVRDRVHASRSQASFLPSTARPPFKAWTRSLLHVSRVLCGSGEVWGQLTSFPVTRDLIFLSQDTPYSSLKSRNLLGCILVLSVWVSFSLGVQYTYSFNMCTLQFRDVFLNYILK